MNKEQTIQAIKAGKRVTIPLTAKQPQSMEQILRNLVNDINIKTEVKQIGHNYHAVFDINTQSKLINKALESIKQLPENDPRNNEEYPNW